MKRYLFAAIAVLINFSLSAHWVEFDLSHIDIGEYTISGPGVNETLSNSGQHSLDLSGQSNYTLRLGSNAKKAAKIKFRVKGNGKLKDLEYKIFGPEGAGFSPVDTSWVKLRNSDRKLEVWGNAIHLSMSQVDQGFSRMPQLIDKGQTAGRDYLEEQDYQLPPGFYRIKLNKNEASFRFTVRLDGTISEDVWFKSPDLSQQVLLDGEFCQVAAQGMVFQGKEVTYEVLPGLSQKMDFQFLKNTCEILPGQNLSFKLLPSTQFFFMRDISDNHKTVRITTHIDPVTALFKHACTWKDLEYNSTGNSFEDMEPGMLCLEPLKVTAGKDLPDPPDPEPGIVQPYATLKPQLDGSYYLATNGELWIKYEERYNSSTDLDLRILDNNHNVLPLASVTREYGPNWIKLDVTPANLPLVSYYVLEVRNPKGELSMLRFVID